ncbi:hypothetical protein ACSV5M_11480 [Cellvibrio sp. ARAG 10.3]|uniref:hypothetical protein n=1 Tax=Cellvibrio sp. ARAG 10.3 TaxID=3451358 RepID=UPI003F46FE4C
MPTRPCDYSLGLQEDSVFMDLSLDQQGCFCLVRISFDGYGCCNLSEIEQEKSTMNSTESSLLKALLDSGDYDNQCIGEILSKFLYEFKDLVWEDVDFPGFTRHFRAPEKTPPHI